MKAKQKFDIFAHLDFLSSNDPKKVKLFAINQLEINKFICRIMLNRVQIRILATAAFIFTSILTFVIFPLSSIIDKGQLRLMEIPKCGCSKFVPFNEGEIPPRKNVTCEMSTIVRGPHQKVVAFTYYDPKSVNNEKKFSRKYFEGIEENLKLIKKFYPGWIMRLYYQVDTEESLKEICNIACSDPDIDICEAANNARLGNATSLYPLVWRFLPVLDIQVDAYLSRDLDSKISSREVAAVKEFLEDPKALVHNMRDHPAHAAYIMGGMWGAKVNELRLPFEHTMKGMFNDGICYAPRDKGGYDQICLAHYMWPWAKRVMMAHDSYLCKSYPNTRPFPTQRLPGGTPANYVGSIHSQNETGSIYEECPEKCRPKNHPEWKLC